MKKCDYCGKEISNFEMYCCDMCEQKALKYYKNEKKFRNIFGFFDVVCIVSILIFCFAALLFSAKVALIGSGVSLVVLGLAVAVFPMPTLNQISRFKIKKAVFTTRLCGFILIGFGCVLFALGII
ncbi:MAG: hypothetical protein K6F76_03880 [Clostridiales bacterium]|nr:hypothetical protein [Clostridiales bacterium]